MYAIRSYYGTVQKGRFVSDTRPRLPRDPQDALAPDSGAASGDVVRCDACPVLCRIRKGQAGACDRYANTDGRLVRVDPLSYNFV